MQTMQIFSNNSVSFPFMKQILTIRELLAALGDLEINQIIFCPHFERLIETAFSGKE